MKDLIQIIKDNPNCLVIVDNDHWWIEKQDRPNEFYDWDDERQEEFDKENKLISSSDDYQFKTDNTTYQEDNCYGGAILLALAEIVGGIKITSV